MCGIVGFAARTSSSALAAAERAGTALDAIRHRGPDADGQYQDGRVWFGHLRLSILDLSDAGHQPMSCDDGRFVITFNGEIYNFRELAAELKLEGLRSHSDTEVLVRAFALMGTNLFRRLNGIFACAIYDRDRQRLWLVRDRLGVKPLYIARSAEGLAFGSEIKAVHAIGGRSPVCNAGALHEWLYYGNALRGRTLHEGVEQLLPGHFLELDLAQFSWTIRQYWALPQQAAERTRTLSMPELIGHTRELLEQAVARQLVSDVPVGVFLSGGIDSSAITAFAARHYRGTLATYSAGFDDRSGADERPKARKLAEQWGTDHHEIEIGGQDVAGLVEKMVHHHDGPFGDAANIPLYQMASKISAHTKVVLQGDGGDEVFGGYRRYATLRYYRWLHLAALAYNTLDRTRATSGLHYRIQRYANAFAEADLGATMAQLLTFEDPRSSPAAVFAPEFRATVVANDPFARYRECQRLVSGHDVGNQMSLVDLMVELPDIFLEKVDRATMATSLEVRVPFLDNDLVDFMTTLPGHVKMPRGRKKWLLKQALHGVVPHEVLYGPKTGFNVPFAFWLRSSLKPFFWDHYATFAREQPRVLDEAVVADWFAQVESGRVDRSHMLWKVLNLMVWCNNSRVAISA